MRMSIMMSFDCHAMQGREAGAWFQGHGYGQKRCVRTFITYKTIQLTLDNHPKLAQDPSGRFYMGKDGKGEKDKNFFTREFTKAMSEGLRVACHKTHRDSSFPKFEKVEHSEVLNEKVATFRDGTKDIILTFDEIAGLLDNNPAGSSDPTKIGFYFNAHLGPKAGFFPGHQLVKAQQALSTVPVPESVRLVHS